MSPAASTPAPALSAALPAELAGSAATQAVGALPADTVVCDMYDPEGASVYHDFTLGDASEVRDILREVRATDGPVLELAAGAGRLTVPLLSLRRDVTAVDLSPAMLALLRERLTALPGALAGRCATVQADITGYVAPEPAGAAVLGTTSVSLLTDAQRRAMLRRTHGNLRPGGAFVLTTAQISEDAADLSERVFDVPGASGTVYRVHDLVAQDRGGRYTVVITPGGEGPRTVCHSFIRVVPPGELTADLTAAGFRVESTITLPGERYTSVLVRAVREE
ncbi:daptide-type RiPP biosynthesis methyltransferase [Streptomyces sp. NPDC006265]|uniref:daptide-type RiPP biosynthesis methyltransferase n=1 Tax=Streptomyces sp. NPDC006265 TaxID=3156740 RepID=UPI0033B3574D